MTPRQTAINFLSLYLKVFTNPKTSNPERVRENSENVCDLDLTDKDSGKIDRLFPISDFDTTLEII